MKKIVLLVCCLSVTITFLSAQPKQEPLQPVYPKNTYDGVNVLFQQYHCSIEQRELITELDKETLETYFNYKEWIIEGANKPVNFGGKYIILEWGCGTSCQTGVIINAETGMIYQLPTSEWGREYRRDSLLLIENPPSVKAEENDRPEWAYPAYYVWSEPEFILLHDTRSVEGE